MSKLKNISGFPEWLPGEKIAENRVIEIVRRVYESFGFVPIETPAVELLTTLGSKGVIDKELYALKRAQDSGDDEAELGLHFDLTVPFARYVAQHLSEIQFPFKRYQVQKVWRGDRPQKGRFREFYQFDLDIVARDELPLACDAEALTAYSMALQSIGLGQFTLKINNRKILRGLYESLGLSELQSKKALIAVDKLDKIGGEKVCAELVREAGLTAERASEIVALAATKARSPQIDSAIAALGRGSEELAQGVQELRQIMDLLPPTVAPCLEFDLSLVRGLDYYTGIIVEARMDAFPQFGSIGGGGRYENLASEFSAQKLPGVGFSIGLTRLMTVGFEAGIFSVGGDSTASVLVTVLSEGERRRCNEIAADLRSYGVATEVFYKSPKLGKQIEYAEKRGIRFVVFVEQGGIQIKDLQSKQQVPVPDLAAWCAAFLASNHR